jgi:hypothetical protein
LSTSGDVHVSWWCGVVLLSLSPLLSTLFYFLFGLSFR